MVKKKGLATFEKVIMFTIVWRFFLFKVFGLCFIKSAPLVCCLENMAYLLAWAYPWVTDFNEPKRSISFHESDNPTHQMWFRRRRKGQSTFKRESRFYPVLCVFGSVIPHFTPPSPSSPFPRHVAQSLAGLHQYKCDSLMYKLAQHMCRR